jgi:putative transposase
VNWAIGEKSYSQRRACGLIGLDPKTYRYASRRSDEVEIRVRLKALADQRRRFGYRRLHILLRREGIAVNHKKLFRLYREERLTVRRRGGRKRALGTRAPMTLPQGPNQRWSLDFVADQLVDGRRFRVLVVSTTSPGSAWRSLSTPRSPASGSPANSMRSSPFAASRSWLSATTALS